MFKTLKWEDCTGFALGVWLIASPWVLEFFASNAATVNAFSMGIILILLDLMEYEEHEASKAWIDLLAGLWLMASPTVLDFTSSTPAAASTAAAGLTTTLIAAWAISPFDELIGRWWREHVARH